jgi:hypothetical protein
MTSLLTSVKTTASDTDYFISVGSMFNRVNAYNPTSNSFSTATWCAVGGQNATVMTGFTSTLSTTTSGVIFRDMGKTVVSSLRTFRKVQVVVPNLASTFGVGGRAAGVTGEDFFQGYVELGFEGNGTPAPLAHFGR